MGLSQNTRFLLSLSRDVDLYKSKQCIIKDEAIVSCTLRKWSGLMKVLAVSSVLGQTIFTVYPSLYHDGIRKLLHGEVFPREPITTSSGILYVMWSRDSNLDNQPGTPFQPNHFVPISMDSVFEKVLSTVNDEGIKHLYENRRNSKR